MSMCVGSWYILDNASRSLGKKVENNNKDCMRLKSYEWLKELSLFSLRKRKPREGITTIFQYLGTYHRGENTRSIYLLVADSMLRTMIGKLNSQRSKLEIRRKFLTVRAIKQWKSLPFRVMATPSLVVFKQRLDGHLFRVIWGFLPLAGNCSRKPLKSFTLLWFYVVLFLNMLNTLH